MMPGRPQFNPRPLSKGEIISQKRKLSEDANRADKYAHLISIIEGGVNTIKGLVESSNKPKATVERYLSALKKMGIVTSSKGFQGEAIYSLTEGFDNEGIGEIETTDNEGTGSNEGTAETQNPMSAQYPHSLAYKDTYKTYKAKKITTGTKTVCISPIARLLEVVGEDIAGKASVTEKIVSVEETEERSVPAVKASVRSEPPPYTDGFIDLRRLGEPGEGHRQVMDSIANLRRLIAEEEQNSSADPEESCAPTLKIVTEPVYEEIPLEQLDNLLRFLASHKGLQLGETARDILKEASQKDRRFRAVTWLRKAIPNLPARVMFPRLVCNQVESGYCSDSESIQFHDALWGTRCRMDWCDGSYTTWSSWYLPGNYSPIVHQDEP